jgi:hypothetical protein
VSSAIPLSPREQLYTGSAVINNEHKRVPSLYWRVPANLPLAVNGVMFFAFDVSSRDIKPNKATLKGLLKMAGIAERKVEILKIDCETCEYDVCTQFSSIFIRRERTIKGIFFNF